LDTSKPVPTRTAASPTPVSSSNDSTRIRRSTVSTVSSFRTPTPPLSSLPSAPASAIEQQESPTAAARRQIDPSLEKEVSSWVTEVLGLPPSNEPLDEFLKSGVILCQLVNKINPGSVKYRESKIPFMMLENINSYLAACNSLGLPSNTLFQPSDLFEKKNMNLVLASIHALGRMSAKIPGFSGPYLRSSIRLASDDS